jgi:hypothetical protein
MFGLSTPARVFLANDPVDMRKQYGGLWALAENKLRENPFGGALFVFTNKSRDRVKMLYWDGSGAWVLLALRAHPLALLGATPSPRFALRREAPRKGPLQLASALIRRGEDLHHAGGADDVARRHRAEGWLQKSAVRALKFFPDTRSFS